MKVFEQKHVHEYQALRLVDHLEDGIEDFLAGLPVAFRIEVGEIAQKTDPGGGTFRSGEGESRRERLVHLEKRRAHQQDE